MSYPHSLRAVVCMALILSLSACRAPIDKLYDPGTYAAQKPLVLAEQTDPQGTEKILDRYIKSQNPDQLQQYTYRELIEQAEKAEADRLAKIEAQRKKEAEQKRVDQRYRELPGVPLKELTSEDYGLLQAETTIARQVRAQVLAKIQKQSARFKAFVWQDLQACAQGSFLSWRTCLEDWKSPAEKAALAKAKADEELREQGLKWNLNTYTDEMSGQPVKTATVKSLNTVNFDFPYAGEQRATLQVRQHPRYGLDILLSIEKGQFQCRLRDCPLVLRFDAGGMQRNDAGRPEDYSSELVFLENVSQVLGQLKRSRTLKIQATFYNEGNRLFEFNTEGLTF